MRSVLTGATSPPAMRRSVASPEADTPSYWPVRISVMKPAHGRATLHFRVPAWVAGPISIEVNGKRYNVAVRVAYDGLEFVGLSERARERYLYARALVGRDFATPEVMPM